MSGRCRGAQLASIRLMSGPVSCAFDYKLNLSSQQQVHLTYEEINQILNILSPFESIFAYRQLLNLKIFFKGSFCPWLLLCLLLP